MEYDVGGAWKEVFDDLAELKMTMIEPDYAQQVVQELLIQEIFKRHECGM